MAPIRMLLGAALFGLLLSAQTASAARVENKALEFSFNSPAGFEEAPSPDSRVLHSYTQPIEGGRLTLNIERLGRAIGKERVGVMGDAKKFQSMLGSKATSTTEEMTWKGDPITLVRIAVDTADAKFIVLQAQVPLTPESISVTVGGPVSQESELRNIIKGTVASIEGKSGWESNTDIFKKLLVPILIGLMALGLWLYQRFSR